MVVVDYEKAIQNLTDILIDSRKFDEMNENIFLAMDEDNSGVLQCDVAEEFVREFLRGTQVDGQTNTDFEAEHVDTLKILSENETGEINSDDMA